MRHTPNCFVDTFSVRTPQTPCINTHPPETCTAARGRPPASCDYPPPPLRPSPRPSRPRPPRPPHARRTTIKEGCVLSKRRPWTLWVRSHPATTRRRPMSPSRPSARPRAAPPSRPWPAARLRRRAFRVVRTARSPAAEVAACASWCSLWTTPRPGETGAGAAGRPSVRPGRLARSDGAGAAPSRRVARPRGRRRGRCPRVRGLVSSSPLRRQVQPRQ